MTSPDHDRHRATLRAEALDVAYGDRPVLHDVDLDLPNQKVTAIVGPNGCGKSTLLKTLARVLSPASGTVWLDGHAIHQLPTRQVARQVGLLPQSTVAPEQLTVADLVARGRYPHRGAFGRWTDTDRQAVEDALAATTTSDLRDRPVDELSGGQRQRVWIAMVLAQQTPVLLLDEPTTYLDLGHRLEVLRLLRQLNQQRHVTVVMVLHDLHEAARHADHLIAMADGRIVAQGPPAATVTPDLVHDVFGVHCTTVPCPVTGAPLIVPLDDPPADPPLRDSHRLSGVRA
jgi:ABC-type cobalamin/Fe3+-siderophores transport system ATPase subunit